MAASKDHVSMSIEYDYHISDQKSNFIETNPGSVSDLSFSGIEIVSDHRMNDGQQSNDNQIDILIGDEISLNEEAMDISEDTAFFESTESSKSTTIDNVYPLVADAEGSLENTKGHVENSQGNLDIAKGSSLTAAPTMPMKKPQTAYFLFLAANREKAKQENPGAKMMELGQILGEKWKNMSTEEKKVFSDLSKQQHNEYEEKKRKAMEAGLYIDGTSVTNSSELSNTSCEFPLARVRRIIQLDPEVQKISKDAALLISKATEKFVAFLTKKCHFNASLNKRKTIRDTDFHDVIYNVTILDWLRLDFPRIVQAKAVPKAKEVRVASLPSEPGQISSFFESEASESFTMDISSASEETKKDRTSESVKDTTQPEPYP